MEIGDLPGKDIPPPLKEDCIRVIVKRTYKNVFVFKNDKKKDEEAQELSDAHDALYGIAINDPSEDLSHFEEFDEKDTEEAKGVSNAGKEGTGGTGGMEGNEVAEAKEAKRPLTPEEILIAENTPRFDEKYYNDLCRKISMKNSANHSLR